MTLAAGSELNQRLGRIRDLKNGRNLVGKLKRAERERLRVDFKGGAADRKAEHGTCAELWGVIPTEPSVTRRRNLARPGSLDFRTLVSSVLSQMKRAA
jgi:hypothetical protein